MGEAPHEALQTARMVWITAPERDVALTLAHGLVERGLAACVNVIPGVQSVYTWEGAVQEQTEFLLVAKTTLERWSDLQAYLAAEHPYAVPECVAVAPSEVEPRYLGWLRAACARAAGDRAD